MVTNRRVQVELVIQLKGIDQAIREMERLEWAMGGVASQAQQVTQNAQGAGRSLQGITQQAPMLNPSSSAPVSGGGGGGGGSKSGVSASGALNVAGRAAGIAGAGEVSGILGQLGSSIGALGPIGAVTTVAAVGLGVAFKELSKESERLRRETELILEARFAEIDATGKTTEEITKQLEAQADAWEKAADKEFAALDKETQLREEQRSGILGGLKDIGDSIGVWSDGVNEAQEAAEKWGAESDNLKASTEGLTAALDSTETAAADAAEALEKAAEAQEESVLKQVDALGKRIKAEQDAQDRSREGNKDRLKAIRDEEKVLQAQVAALKASGVSGEKAAEKLEALTGQLKMLGDESQITQKAIREGTHVDREAAAERVRITKAENAERMQDMRNAARERAEERKKEEREHLKDQIEFGNKILDIQYDEAKRKYDIQIQADRDQERLMREHIQSETQEYYQDFMGLFTQQNALAFRLKETQIGAQQGMADATLQGYLSQQKLRAQTPGAQQLLGGAPGGGNTININTGMDPNAMMAIIQQMEAI